MPEPPVIAENLKHLYGPRRGIDGVSLQVDGGECLALLGRNGSGKSTLLRLVLGLQRPQAGRLTVLGCDAAGGRRRHLRRCGAALDASAHWDALSGRQNLHFIARSCGLSAAAATRRCDELLQWADLAAQADEPVGGYSLGMRRKLGIIQAVVHDPELLVLDEPTLGLDAHFQIRLAELIRGRGRRGKATLLAGNDPEFAAAVAGRVAFIDAGRIRSAGSVDELLDELAPLEEVTIDLASRSELPPPELAGLRCFSQDGTRITAVAERRAAAVGPLVQWVTSHGGQLTSLEVRKGTLRDAFLLATGRGLDA